MQCVDYCDIFTHFNGFICAVHAFLWLYKLYDVQHWQCSTPSSQYIGLFFWVCAVLILNITILFLYIYQYQCLILSWWLLVLPTCLRPWLPNLNYRFRYPESNFGSVILLTSVMFPPMEFLLEYWTEHVTSTTIMSNLYSQLGYSAGEFQALQMIILAVFGAVY